jgi:hypothetical protein
VKDPQISITPGDSTQVCEGDSVFIQATGGFAAYLWNNNRNTQNIYASTTGHYSVTATDNAGCEVISDSVSITILPNPGTPTVNGPTMVFLQATDTFSITGQPGSTFQWGSTPFVNLSATGDTAFANWRVVGPQTFWVIETSADGCEGDTFFIQVTVGQMLGMGPLPHDQPYSLYPNPAEEEIFVEFELAPKTGVLLILFDAKGRRVQETFSREAKNRMDLQGLAAGIYMLEIRLGETVVWEKVWVR